MSPFLVGCPGVVRFLRNATLATAFTLALAVGNAQAIVTQAPSPADSGKIILKTAQTWDMDVLGSFFQYIPRWVTADTVPLVVMVHGTAGDVDGQPGDAEDAAFKYIERSLDWADRHQVILIAPIFDQTNFGSVDGFANPFGPDTGNYRWLIGRPRGGLTTSERDPDDFLNAIIDDYSLLYDEGQSLPYDVEAQVLLYGHSAGGQFANRYLVKHSDRVQASFLSSPKAYVQPFGEPYADGDPTDPTVDCQINPGDRGCNFVWAVGREDPLMDWPWGPAQGSGSVPYNWIYQLPSNAFALAAEVPTLVMTSEDDEPPGEIHYERAFIWASAMGSDWQIYSGGHSSSNTQVQYAHPFFEEQPAVADERHRFWWVPLF